MHERNAVRPESARPEVARVLAPALATTAGFVDAVGYITLHGLFVAHMSGNSVKFGVDAGRGELDAAAPAGVAVVLFVAGVALGTVVAELTARRAIAAVAAPVLAIQAALIATFMLYGRTLLSGDRVPGRSLDGFYVLAALAILSMGMQTAALRQLGGRTIATTYVTGTLTSLAQEATNYAFWRRDGAARDERRSFLSRVLGLGSREESRNRVLLLGTVWIAYVGGGVLGSFCDRNLRLWSLLIPLALLVAIAARDIRRPLAC
jgi:uncharacterized membrane protein YoaK (UPF0700 family)